MNWIMENWVNVLIIYSAVVTIASVIVKLTPTQTDDAVLAKILKFLELVALNAKPVVKK